MSNKLKAYLCFIFISFVWGSTWVANKYTVNFNVPPLQIACIRQCIGGLIMVLFFIFFKKEKLPNWKIFKWLIGMAILVFIMSNAIANVALKYIPSGLAALIAALYPLSIILIDYFVYKRVKITLIALIGIFLGIFGIGLISLSDTHFTLDVDFWLGVILSVIAMISWSISTVIISNHNNQINNYYSIGWQMTISGVMLFIWLQFTSNTMPLQDIPIKAWSAIIYLIFGGNVFAFIAFIFAMKYLGVSMVSLYAYINPIVTIIIASFWINEPITKSIVLGSFITLLGIFLVNKTLKEQKDNRDSLIEAEAM